MRWLELHEADNSPHFVNVDTITEIFRWEGVDEDVTIRKVDGMSFDCIESYEMVTNAISVAARHKNCVIKITDKGLEISGVIT